MPFPVSVWDFGSGRAWQITQTIVDSVNDLRRLQVEEASVIKETKISYEISKIQ